MPSCGTACCQFPSTPCAWCSTFGSSPPPISQTENDPYVRIAREHNAEGSLIRFFMRDHEGPVGCLSKADLVDDFCAGASITPHESGADADANEDADARHVALVDDRSNDGNVAVSRKNPGALTAKVLLRYLSTMVRFKRGSRIRAGAAQSGREFPEQEDSLVGQPNADRRLLYVTSNFRFIAAHRVDIFRFVTDLDCKAVLALVHTALERQARALRDSIYNHLASKASIIAAISNFPSSSTPEYPATASKASTMQIEQARNRTIKIIGVVTRLIQSLLSISNYRAEFDSQRAAYFRCMDSSAQQTLQTIQDIFLQLEALGKDFNHLRDCCEQLRKDYLSDLQDRSMKSSIETAKQTQALIQMQYQLADKQCQVIEAQYETSKKQQEIAGRSMAMETVMLVSSFVLPSRFTTDPGANRYQIVALITSVIAIFSIPKGNNLFPTDPRLFILIVIIFGLMAYAMQVCLVDPSRCLKLLSCMLEKLWDVTANICTYLSGRFRDLRETKDPVWSAFGKETRQECNGFWASPWNDCIVFLEPGKNSKLVKVLDPVDA
ncbi:hypothetical protein AUP68_06356 [Ilyonectria robusta]